MCVGYSKDDSMQPSTLRKLCAYISAIENSHPEYQKLNLLMQNWLKYSYFREKRDDYADCTLLKSFKQML